jgi:hypothetical protein
MVLAASVCRELLDAPYGEIIGTQPNSTMNSEPAHAYATLCGWPSPAIRTGSWEMEGDLRAIRDRLDEYLAVVAKPDNGRSAINPPNRK